MHIITIETTQQPYINAWGIKHISPTTTTTHFGIAPNQLQLHLDAANYALDNIHQPTIITIKLGNPHYIHHIGQWLHHNPHPHNIIHRWKTNNWTHQNHTLHNLDKWKKLYKHLAKHHKIQTIHGPDPELYTQTYTYLTEHLSQVRTNT